MANLRSKNLNKNYINNANRANLRGKKNIYQ